MANLGKILVSDVKFVYNTLFYVLEYLDIKDLLSCALVCPLWKWVVLDDRRWKNLQICCCENDLQSVNAVLGGHIRRVVIKMNKHKLTKDFHQLLTENNLSSVTFVDCVVEHLYVLSRYQTNIEELYAVNCAQRTFLPADPGLFGDLKFLHNQENLRHLTLNSVYGPTTWWEVGKLVNLESLTIHADNTCDHWIDVLFKQKAIIGLTHLKKLKLVSYLQLFVVRREYFVFERLVHLENLKELSLIGISFRSDIDDRFYWYLRKYASLEKLEMQFGDVEKLWNSNFADRSLLNKNADDNMRVVTALLDSRQIKTFHWVIEPQVYIFFPDHFAFMLLHLTDWQIALNAQIRSDGFAIGLPIQVIKHILLYLKPKINVIFEDVNHYRENKSEKRCIGCDQVVSSSGLLQY